MLRVSPIYYRLLRSRVDLERNIAVSCGGILHHLSDRNPTTAIAKPDPFIGIARAQRVPLRRFAAELD